MSKESYFLVYCIERYRFFKGLSGEEVSELFKKYNLFEYVKNSFEVLHIMGDVHIVQDIDDYIESKILEKSQN